MKTFFSHSVLIYKCRRKRLFQIIAVYTRPDNINFLLQSITARENVVLHKTRDHRGFSPAHCGWGKRKVSLDHFFLFISNLIPPSTNTFIFCYFIKTKSRIANVNSLFLLDFITFYIYHVEFLISFFFIVFPFLILIHLCVVVIFNY